MEAFLQVSSFMCLTGCKQPFILVVTTCSYFCRLKKLGLIMKTSHYHQLVRLFLRSAMLEIHTWMGVHHGLSLSKGVMQVKLLQRWSFVFHNSVGYVFVRVCMCSYFLQSLA